MGQLEVEQVCARRSCSLVLQGHPGGMAVAGAGTGEGVPGCSAPRPPQDDWGWSRHGLGWPWVVGMWLELV